MCVCVCGALTTVCAYVRMCVNVCVCVSPRLDVQCVCLCVCVYVGVGEMLLSQTAVYYLCWSCRWQSGIGDHRFVYS